MVGIGWDGVIVLTGGLILTNARSFIDLVRETRRDETAIKKQHEM